MGRVRLRVRFCDMQSCSAMSAGWRLDSGGGSGCRILVRRSIMNTGTVVGAVREGVLSPKVACVTEMPAVLFGAVVAGMVVTVGINPTARWREVQSLRCSPKIARFNLDAGEHVAQVVEPLDKHVNHFLAALHGAAGHDRLGAAGDLVVAFP